MDKALEELKTTMQEVFDQLGTKLNTWAASLTLNLEEVSVTESDDFVLEDEPSDATPPHPAEVILYRLLESSLFGMHYFNIEDGVISVRVDFTDPEEAYLVALQHRVIDDHRE